jgi:hypothetical protein
MFRTSVGAIREKIAKLSQQPSVVCGKQSPEDVKRRKSALNGVLRTLKRGGHIQNRQLKTWLTKEEFEEFEALWIEQRELRAELKRKPSSLVEYEALLKRGLFAEAKAEGYKRSNAKSKARAHNDAQRHYEVAIEFLLEQLQMDPSLAQWIDRNVSDSAADATALCGSAMPRCVTSRSLDRGTGGLQIALQSKNEVKIAVVERALERCG